MMMKNHDINHSEENEWRHLRIAKQQEIGAK